jgi:hypothetical protein
LKRVAYNVAWMKIDPLWVAIIRAGLMPFATRIFERVLRVHTKNAKPGPGVPPTRVDTAAGEPLLVIEPHTRRGVAPPAIEKKYQPLVIEGDCSCESRPS